MKPKITHRVLSVAKPKQSPQPGLATQMIGKLRNFDEDDCYWSVKDIAQYTGLNVHTIRRNFLHDPRWPVPLVSGSGARNSSKRWLASEVKKALLLFRQRRMISHSMSIVTISK